MLLEGEHKIVAEQTKILSNFLAKTNFEDLPYEVVERAKLTIADTIGVAIKGSLEPEMQKLYERLPQGGEAVVLKKGFPKTDISMASFVNTTAACFIELDEGSIQGGHPALHVLPPVLALAQELDKSGAELITAFVLGYEVQYRLQIAFKLRDSVYPHGNTGHVGAAVAMCKLMGWNAEQIEQAINCAAALPLGTSYAPTTKGSTIVAAFASFSAPIAFIVKKLVESGFTGYDCALYDTYNNILGYEYDPLVLTDKIGIEYGLMKNYFKFHANCGVVHPALESAADALDFRIQHDEYPPYKPSKLLNPNDIKSIKVIQGRDMFYRGMFIANNKVGGKFSIPYSLAVFLVTGYAGEDSYSEELLQNDQIKSLQKLVTLEVDESLSERPFGAKIIIELKDGRLIDGKSNSVYGRPDNPSNQEDLYNKFCALTADAMDEESRNKIWNVLISLDKQKRILEVF